VDVLEGESLGPREQGGYIVAGVVLARLRAVRVSKGNHGPTARRSGGAKAAALIGQGARRKAAIDKDVFSHATTRLVWSDAALLDRCTLLLREATKTLSKCAPVCGPAACTVFAQSGNYGRPSANGTNDDSTPHQAGRSYQNATWNSSHSGAEDDAWG
jgi:hypothetical protein